MNLVKVVIEWMNAIFSAFNYLLTSRTNVQDGKSNKMRNEEVNDMLQVEPYLKFSKNSVLLDFVDVLKIVFG